MFVPVVFWGLWVSQPNGQWKWICEEMINTNRFRKFALSTDGAFYTTDIKGLTQSTDHGCTWTPATGDIANLHTTDVDVDPVDGATAYVSTGDGGTVTDDGGDRSPPSTPSIVTHDHGATWTPLAGLATDSMRLFQQRARRPRLPPRSSTSTSNNADAALLDRRCTARPTAARASPLPSSPTSSTASTRTRSSSSPSIRATPTSSGRAPPPRFPKAAPPSTASRSCALPTAAPPGPSSTRSTPSPNPPARPAASTASPSTSPAQRVYVATRTGLVAGSDDGGTTTTPTLAATGTLSQSQCVDVHGGGVYVCSSQFPPDNAAIAELDRQRRQTFHSVLNYVDTLGPVDCPAGTPVGDLCPSYWYMYGAQLGISFDGGTPGDAGMMMTPHGCGCSVGAVESAVGGLGFAALLLALGFRTVARSEGRARRRD